ncbi:YjjG family noncanonical pyrimidine nucleotidase [Romboutsia timonensis]|uniref:YjjG family noncanonical pyrimidine nucleotidase n=1 Tax=Romboutsia timonensis TaxID=1776391 RepID=UPI0008D9A1D8|nr:YjjG family noncanonical pyrimidine nucleotidase [Romboutsia timonensis]
MKYKVILFDADDTLFDFKKTEKYALESLMSSLDTDYDKDYCINIYKEINTKIWKEFEEGKITSDDLKIERFQRLIDKLNLSDDATRLSELYVKFLSQGSFLYEDTKDLLDYLSKNYKLGIITNGLADVQHKRIRESDVGHYFDDVIISDEIKIAKPNPEIFEYALKSLNHDDKSSVLMVGDSLSSDIKGGLNASIDTCWCNLSNKINNTDIVPKYEINNLLDLENIL